jgi:hypothetical protein
MKNNVKQLMREIRKQRKNKKFIITETGNKKWEMEIRLPLIPAEKYQKVKLDFEKLTELGFEIGIAQWDYENKVLYEKLKEQYTEKKGGNDVGNRRCYGIGNGNNRDNCQAFKCLLLCAGKRLKRLFAKRGK